MSNDDEKESLADVFKESGKPVAWKEFEAEVAERLIRKLKDGELALDGSCTRVTPKRKLYSKAREAEITFDVVLEVFAPGSQETPMLVWIWECKDYPDRRVTVDEVEEFHSKLQQVGAHKGTIVTRYGFQQGAVNFAKSHGIGLMTLNKQKEVVMMFSRDGGVRVLEQVVATYCLYTFGLEIGGPNDASGPHLETAVSYEWKKSNLCNRQITKKL